MFPEAGGRTRRAPPGARRGPEPPPPPYQGTVPEELYIRLARDGPVEAPRGGVQARMRTSSPE